MPARRRCLPQPMTWKEHETRWAASPQLPPAAHAVLCLRALTSCPVCPRSLEPGCHTVCNARLLTSALTLPPLAWSGSGVYGGGRPKKK